MIKKCLNCGSESFVEGRQTVYASIFRLGCLLPWRWAGVVPKAFVCRTCGFVHYFTDPEKVKRLIVKNT